MRAGGWSSCHRYPAGWPVEGRRTATRWLRATCSIVTVAITAGRALSSTLAEGTCPLVACGSCTTARPRSSVGVQWRGQRRGTHRHAFLSANCPPVLVLDKNIGHCAFSVDAQATLSCCHAGAVSRKRVNLGTKQDTTCASVAVESGKVKCCPSLICGRVDACAWMANQLLCNYRGSTLRCLVKCVPLQSPALVNTRSSLEQLHHASNITSHHGLNQLGRQVCGVLAKGIAKNAAISRSGYDPRSTSPPPRN
mmetsp:Transcript_8060/g.25286  ORF Transcript_8060/g.25286 Transcript_8060/m.25286 type:complete len:252 (-) Transcript_8060:242-997(-)